MSSAANPAFKIKILDCKLYVRRVTLNPSIFIGHAKGFEINTAKYPIRRVVTKAFNIAANTFNVAQENVFSGQLPSRIVVGLVDNAAYNGSCTHNPFNFKNYDLTQIKILIDGQAQYIKTI